MKFDEWYHNKVLGLLLCKKCGSTLETIGVDSSGHEIITPCEKCHIEWRDEQRLLARPIDRTEE